MPRRRVIVADDDPGNLRLVQKLLEAKNFTVFPCTNGYEVLELIENREHVDAVLLDVVMPNKNGYDVCQSIQTMRPGLPVIMMTALNESEALQRAFDSGAWDYINKPVNEIELVSRLTKAIEHCDNEMKIHEMLSSIMQDLQLASNLQHCLIPHWNILQHPILFTSAYHPVAIIGGDFFDILPVSKNEMYLYIGDVSGHGIEAALIMTAVRVMIRYLIQNENEDVTLNNLVSKLHLILSREIFHHHFMTLMICRIDLENNTMEYFSAGHPPLLIRDNDTGLYHCNEESGAIPIGIIEDFDYSNVRTNKIPILDNETYIFYTDGLFEGMNQKKKDASLYNFLKFMNTTKDVYEPVALPYQIIDTLDNNDYDLSHDDFSIVAFSKIQQTQEKKQDYITMLPVISAIHKTLENCYQASLSLIQNNEEIVSKINTLLRTTLEYIVSDDYMAAIDDPLLILLHEEKHKPAIRVWVKGKVWQATKQEPEESLHINFDELEQCLAATNIEHVLNHSVVRSLTLIDIRL